MNYDVVKNSVNNAYVNYRINNCKFYSSMNEFFKEGKKNPSVAKILLHDGVAKHQKQARNMLTEIAAVPGPEFFEPIVSNSRINLYYMSISAFEKSMKATELYKNSEFKGSDSTNNGPDHKKEFESEWEKLYPKTGALRNRIIEAKRISMDKVTKKTSWYEKINIVKTIGEYVKDYPKTILARYKLILNDQIREGEVTPRLRGMFKRFTYAKLIKGKFSFKK